MMRDAFAADVPAPITVTPAKELAPLVVDLQTAAKLVGCSDRHLRKHVVGGPAEYQPKLAVCRIGGRLVVRLETLKEWLARCEAGEPKGGSEA